MIEVRHYNGNVEARPGIEFLSAGETFRVPMLVRSIEDGGKLVERTVTQGVWLTAVEDPCRVEYTGGRMAWSVRVLGEVLDTMPPRVV